MSLSAGFYHKNNLPISIGGVLCALLLGLGSGSVSANTLISDHRYLEHELPQSLQDKCLQADNCPDIDIQYIKSNQSWMNNIVNARVNNIVINSQPSESKTSDKTDSSSVKAALDDFAKSQFRDMPANRPWSYQLMVTPRYIGHVSQDRQNFELFEIDSYVFTGGAHGLPMSEYLIFDTNTQAQVTLDDMLLQGRKSQFKALAYEAYKTWVKTHDEDVKNYEQNWPFHLDDNVTLTDNGIDIRYPHYAIGPYAYGMPILSIPYTQLQGIIKPRFILK